MVWMLCVSLLLIPSVGRSDEYDILPEQKGDIVQRTGYNVTDTHIKVDRVTQIERDKLREKADAAPIEENKSYIDGVTHGALVSLLLYLALL